MIYLLLVDRFVNGDPQNDEVVDPSDASAFHGGDLAGVERSLPALQAMGVEAVWLTPIWAMRDTPFFGHGAFHGYWTEDLGRIDPRFGDTSSLRRLAGAARQQGIGLILDMVYNHVAPDGAWTVQHPDWFHPTAPITDWNDPFQLQNHQVHGLPDLDTAHPDVLRHLTRATRKWVRVAHPVALRVDAVRHLDPALLPALAQRIPRLPPLLGEVFDGNVQNVALSVRETGMDAVFDFPMHYALVDTFCRGADPGAIGAVLGLDDAYPIGTTLVPFLDNHDTPRIASACGGDPARVTAALTALFTLRGRPMITWGTESMALGTTEPENRGDYDPANQPLGETIARLATARRASAPLREGTSRVVDYAPGRLQFVRIAGDEAVEVTIAETVTMRRVPVPAAAPASVTVRIEGPPGTRIVGSRPELGSWDPTKSVALPATLTLPPVLTAWKLVRPSGDGWTWADGPNAYLWPTSTPTLTVTWPAPAAPAH